MTTTNARSRTRQLHVSSKQWVSPHLVRITLTGEDMAFFPQGSESANCKLVFSIREGETVVRTYTVRSYREADQEIDIDFFIHDAPGPASDWARGAEVGDTIGFKGPSSPKLVNTNADWIIIAGDMSAMPAMEANIERMPSTAKGTVVFEVVSEADIRTIAAPKGINLQWLINPHPDHPNDLLVEAVTSVPIPSKRISAWVAGESSSIRALRQYFKDELSIEKTHFYGSGYWQIGLTEDAHQISKRSKADDN